MTITASHSSASFTPVVPSRALPPIPWNIIDADKGAAYAKSSTGAMARRILDKAPDPLLKLKRRHDRRETTDGSRDTNHDVVGNNYDRDNDDDNDEDDDDDHDEEEVRNNIRLQWEQMTSSSKKKKKNIPPISFGPKPIKSSAKKVTIDTFDSDRLLHPWHREMNKMKSEVRRQQEVHASTDIMAEVGGHPQPSTERSNSAGITIQPSSSSSSSSSFVSDPKQEIARKSGKKLKKPSSKEVKASSGIILPSLEIYHPSHVVRSRSPIAAEDDGILSRKAAPWSITNDTSAITRGERSYDKETTTLHRFNSMQQQQHQQLQLMPLSSPMGSRPTTSQSNYSDNDNMSRPSTGSSTGSRGHINRSNSSQGVLNSPNNSFLDWGDRFGSSSTTNDGGSLELSHNSSLSSSSSGSPFPSPSRELGPSLRGDAISRVSNIVTNNLSTSPKKASTRISMSSFEPIPELVSGHDGDEDMDDDIKEANRHVNNIIATSNYRKQNDQIATNKVNTSSRTATSQAVDSSNDDGDSDESDDEEIGWSPFTMVNK